MKYINCGENGKLISKIGLGGSKLGTSLPEDLSFQMLDLFAEKGGTVIDTARSYSPWVIDGRGKSEKIIGSWLQLRNNREKMVVVTKGGISEDGSINITLNKLKEEAKESLDALQTDYVDFYFIHKDDPSMPIGLLVENLQRIKELTNARKIGISNIGYSRFVQAVNYSRQNGLFPISTVQTWWSVAEYKKEMWNDPTTTYLTDDMYAYLLKNNMICFAYTSQCKGYFQKYIEGEKGAISEFLKYRIETQNNIKIAEYIKKICDRNKVRSTAVINGYVTSNRLKGVALVAPTTLSQLEENMIWSDYDVEQFVMDEIDQLKKSEIHF